MKRAVGYIRVSTVEQAKGVSLDMQREKIKAYADLEDMELIDIISDEGISGCSLKIRPGVQRVIKMVRQRQVKAVIIYKLDRLSRNTIEALELARVMDQKGVALHSITEKLDTRSAMGRFFFTLMASVAEMERELVSERIVAAMDLKRSRGEALNNNPLFGYRIAGDRLVPDLHEQKIIQRVQALRSEGHTIHGIVEILNREGITNRKGRPFGKSQTHALISRMAA